MPMRFLHEFFFQRFFFFLTLLAARKKPASNEPPIFIVIYLSWILGVCTLSTKPKTFLFSYFLVQYSTHLFTINAWLDNSNWLCSCVVYLVCCVHCKLLYLLFVRCDATRPYTHLHVCLLFACLLPLLWVILIHTAHSNKYRFFFSMVVVRAQHQKQESWAYKIDDPQVRALTIAGYCGGWVRNG